MSCCFEHTWHHKHAASMGWDADQFAQWTGFWHEVSSPCPHLEQTAAPLPLFLQWHWKHRSAFGKYYYILFNFQISSFYRFWWRVERQNERILLVPCSHYVSKTCASPQRHPDSWLRRASNSLPQCHHSHEIHDCGGHLGMSSGSDMTWHLNQWNENINLNFHGKCILFLMFKNNFEQKIMIHLLLLVSQHLLHQQVHSTVLAVD